MSRPSAPRARDARLSGRPLGGYAAVAALVSVLAGAPGFSADAQAPAAQAPSGSQPATEQTPSTSDAGRLDVVPLRPGDVVRLRIWREPDLSGDFSVEESGVVVLPKLGPMSTTGRPPAELKAQLVARYRPELQHDAISVVFLRRVQILGAVRNPGLYPVDPTLTVGDALALAGGTTPQGDPERLRLVRDGRRMNVSLSSRTMIATSPIQSSDQIFVPERSMISRNPGVIFGAISAVGTLVWAFRRR